MREGRPKIGTIKGSLPGGAGNENILAFGAEKVDSAHSWGIRKAHWQDRLHLAIHPGTTAKVQVMVFFQLSPAKGQGQAEIKQLLSLIQSQTI